MTPEETEQARELAARLNGLARSMRDLGLIDGPEHVPSLVLKPWTGAGDEWHEHVCACCSGKAMFAGPRIQGRCVHPSLCARCRSVSWRNEACSSCGMDDLPVTGPESARLCPYCDERRTLAPAPEHAEPVPRRRRLPPPRAVPLVLIGLSAIGAGVPAVPLTLVAVFAGIAVVLWASRRG